MNKFAPLTQAEMDTAASATPAHRSAEDDLVAPVPVDAPPPPSAHYHYGAAVAAWKYLDATGALLFEVRRFEPQGERKQILPLSLWCTTNSRLEWKWKSYPAPRPLYNLDRLAAHADAPVLVVEGEKAADAAARVFPEAVVTTSPGGSHSVGKADWMPVTGRKVLVWPDADAPGSKYATAVAETLTAMGCDVSVIDAMALAAMAPDGSKREVVKGWDCADAVDEWIDLEALRKATLALAKPVDTNNGSSATLISVGDYTMNAAEGLTIEVEKGRGEHRTIETLWIAQPFEVLGACRDPHGAGWGKWLRWRDRDGREHKRHVSDASLQGDPASLCAGLADEGLLVNRSAQRHLLTYLSSVSPKGRVTMVARTGWHMVSGRDVFVLPEETIDPKGSETVILDALAVGPYEASGSLEDWRSGVGALAADHMLAVLSISAALAGPLLHLAGQEGGGLNLFGPSSKGKTTLLQAGASVWGRGGSPGYVRAWRATANGLEGAAASASDTCLVLDELGVVEARDAASAVYGLSNGTGKARAARDGSLREPKTWRVLLLSTGEIPIAAKLAEDKGRRARAGQLVRLLDIPADRGRGFGAFDHAGPNDDAAALAKAIKHASIAHYGTAGPEFVRRLIAEGVDGESIKEIVSDFVSAHLSAGADGQIDRAAQRLGLIAAAGELATALGVTPWREGVAREAAAWALAQWIANRGGTEPAEVRQAIETVRLVIETHGESRFEPFDSYRDPDARPVPNRLGWRTGSGQDAQWLIPPEVWRSEVCAGLDPKFVAKALGDRGMLEKAGDGWQPTRRIAGRVHRVYVVLASIFDEVDHGH